MNADLSYPIGRFTPPSSGSASPEQRQSWIESITAAPSRLRSSVSGLTPEQLDTPYRPGGWTVRQLVHHVPDSHLNAYVRFKLALTEDVPTIKPYDQDAWSDLADVRDTPVETSLVLLEKIHDRWLRLVRALDSAAFERRYRHPETGNHSLDYMLAHYAWHGDHHIAQINALITRMGWASA